MWGRKIQITLVAEIKVKWKSQKVVWRDLIYNQYGRSI